MGAALFLSFVTGSASMGKKLVGWTDDLWLSLFFRG